MRWRFYALWATSRSCLWLSVSISLEPGEWKLPIPLAPDFPDGARRQGVQAYHAGQQVQPIGWKRKMLNPRPTESRVEAQGRRHLTDRFSHPVPPPGLAEGAPASSAALQSFVPFRRFPGSQTGFLSMDRRSPYSADGQRYGMLGAGSMGWVRRPHGRSQRQGGTGQATALRSPHRHPEDMPGDVAEGAGN